MHLLSIPSSLLAIAVITLTGIGPVSTMVIDVSVNTDTLLRTQTPFNTLVSCGFPSGNCYDNGCDGEKGTNSDTCTGGDGIVGCPCGYNCGRDTGSCFDNGCNGAPDPNANGRPRCRGKFYGCDCNL